MALDSPDRLHALKGIEQSALAEPLRRVSRKFEKAPAKSIVDIDQKLAPFAGYIAAEYGEDFDFSESYHLLRREVLSGFSMDEICKLKHSSVLMMNDTVEKLFKSTPPYSVVFKIENSMWRWGFGKGTWNEVVDAYDGLRDFRFTDDADFEVRLDHTTGYNQKGLSEYSRTFLDGVFGFLVYYKGKHALTLGFSIVEGRKILLQQVQGAQRSGNRALYKLPDNKLEYAISRFREAFPKHDIYMVHGDSMVDDILANYNRSLLQTLSSIEKEKGFLASIPEHESERRSSQERWIQRKEEDRDIFQQKIAHVEADRERLVSVYGNAGRYMLGPDRLELGGMKHLKVSE